MDFKEFIKEINFADNLFSKIPVECQKQLFENIENIFSIIMNINTKTLHNTSDYVAIQSFNVSLTLLYDLMGESEFLEKKFDAVTLANTVYNFEWKIKK